MLLPSYVLPLQLLTPLPCTQVCGLSPSLCRASFKVF